MRILSIETSCDETSLALVDCTGTAKAPVFNVLKLLTNSQIELHREWGGVVPNIAKREHIKNLPLLLNELGISYKLEAKSYKLPTIDAIAVTIGPGLEPALWAGIEFAKQLAKDLNKPLLGANHMEGHMFSVLLNAEESDKQQELGNKLETKKLDSRFLSLDSRNLRFPAIGLVVSGGHTILVKMDSYTKWTNLGETRDDAAGEAFDKVARMLKLPYPGGPEISKLALKGDPTAIDFPRPMLKDKGYEFSFSGIKTSVLYYLRDNPLTAKSSKLKANLAASFQQAVIDVLVKKTMRAAKEFGAQTVFVCGGVAANKELRRQLSADCEKWGIAFMAPANEYNTDNAAMIAPAAYLAKLRKKKYKMVADSTMTL
jgi:N6-L-threonylcarbamoyladenine synthase